MMLGCFYPIPDGVTCAGGEPCLESILVGDGGCQARRSGNLSLELTLPGAGRTLTQYLLPQGQKVLPCVFSALSDWEVGDARLVGSECFFWLPRAGWAPTQSLLVLLAGKVSTLPGCVLPLGQGSGDNGLWCCSFGLEGPSQLPSSLHLLESFHDCLLCYL